jgi:putative tryptophan/tyrosine transport system substrate-binding protein
MAIHIQRRELMFTLGGAAAWTLPARAQQAGKLPVVGLLSSRSPATDAPLIVVMREGLSETGLVEGRDFTTDYRSAEGQYERLASLAADLVHRQVTVIVAIGGEVAALAAKTATATNTNRFRRRHRPGAERHRHQSESSRRQYHGCKLDF